MSWADAFGSEFIVEVLRPDDGVPPNVVSGFAQGADGYLWMASDQTLARYDGWRFVDVGTDTLAVGEGERDGLFRHVARLFTGASGAVWMSQTAGDLWRWGGREFELWFPTNTATRAFARVLELGAEGVLAVSRSGEVFRGTRNRVWPITVSIPGARLLPESVCLDSGGQVWLLTDRGSVWRVNLPDSKDALASTAEFAAGAQSLTADAAGSIWLGTVQGLQVWRGDRWESIPPPVMNQPFPVRTVLPGPSGVIWVSSRQKAWVWREGQWTGPVGDWPDQVSPFARVVDHSGRLWLAPPTQGLWCLRLDGTATQLGPESGVDADGVVLFCDREGTIWVSIYRIGIARVRERRFTPVVVTAGLHTTPLWNIGEDASGAIWLAPEFRGPVRWREGGLDEFTLQGERRGRVLWTKALAVDRSGQVWAAAMGAGVLRFEDGAFQAELPWPSGAGFSRVLLQDRSDRWWLGSDRGLHCWSNGRWEAWDATRGLPAKGVRAIAEDAEGHLWVATFGGGVARLDGERFTVFGRAEGLPHESVYALCAGADGSLWIGTHGGLARRRNGRFTRYTVAQGLPDHRVVQVLEDHLRFLWLGTRDGLCRIPISSLDAADRGKSPALECLVFDQKDGLPTRLFQDRSAPACWRARDGRLWFLTAGAAVYCRPERIQPNQVKPSVTIEEVILDGHPWSPPPGNAEVPTAEAEILAAVALKAPSRITLSPGSHLIEIRYTAPSLVVADDARFEHKLDGLDSRWVKAGSQRSVHYSGLPPRTYRFRVRASNNDGIWNPVSAELEVVIEPHFWQRKWFPVLITLMVVGFTGGAGSWFQRTRLRRQMAQLELQRAREAERTRISRDLHDHLGASLTEVGMLAADGAEAVPLALRPSSPLGAIEEKVRAMIGDLDSMVWAIDPQKDALPALASYLASFVNDYCASSGLDCRLDIQRGLPAWPVRSETRHHLFLAVKEATHNAVRHARATRLLLRLTLLHDQLEITLQDNGCGFDPPTTLPGNGLVNLRERLTYLGGRCDLASRPGEGTVVRLVLPLPTSDSL